MDKTVKRKKADNNYFNSNESSGKHVKFVCEFYDEKWCKNRSVTDVNWSLKVCLL